MVSGCEPCINQSVGLRFVFTTIPHYTPIGQVTGLFKYLKLQIRTEPRALDLGYGMVKCGCQTGL